MAWVDLSIVAVLVFTTIIGFRRGLVRQVIELMGIICGVFFGLRFTMTVVENWTGSLAQFPGTPALVFIAIVVVTMLVAQIIGRVASEVMEVSFFGWFDQIGGAIAGFAKGALWLSIAISVLGQLHVARNLNDHFEVSTLAQPISGLLPAAFVVVKAYAEDAQLKEPFEAARR